MKGFSLIEILIYLAIIALIVVVLANFAINFFSAKTKAETMREVEQNMRFAQEKMTRTIRNAAGINSPIFGSSASSLSLSMADGAKDPTIFQVSGGQLTIKEGVSSAVAITSSKVNVSSLTFTNVSYAGTKGTVRIEITIDYNNPASQPDYQYQLSESTSATVRGRP